MRATKGTLALGGVMLVGIIAVFAGGSGSRAATPGTRSTGGRITSNTWSGPVRQIDAALARGDVSLAVRAWHDAYLAALGSRSWEGLVDVGDAYLRIETVSGGRNAAMPRARELYLSALIRARAERSLEGVLRVTEAFATLGDLGLVSRSLAVAETLVAGSEAGVIVVSAP